MRRAAILAASTLTLTLFVLSPSEIFFSSPLEFPFLLGDFLGYGFALALLTALILAALAWTLTPSSSERYVALLASFSVALWLQSTFLPWPYGPLDGRPLGSLAERPWAGLDLLLWIVVFAAPQFFAKLRRPDFIGAACMIALAAQGASFLARARVEKDYTKLKQYSIDPAPRFEFSSGENVFLIILDEFQADILPDVLEKRPSLRQDLRGFTFFRGVLASAKQTFPAIPEMLTGQRYLNEEPIADYLNRVFSTDSLFQRMTQHGYRTEVYPYTTGTIQLSPEWAANIVSSRPQPRQVLRLFDAGLFRAAPFVLKSSIYREGHWLTVDLGREVPLTPGSRSTHFTENPKSVPAFQHSLREARIARDEKVFKFYHLAGTHIPISFDENLRPRFRPYGRASYLAQATGAMQVMANFFEKLRELGIYDRALIVIAGDHGSGRKPDLWIRPQDPSRADFNMIKARGCPLLLIKRPNEDGELRISPAQVSLLDLRVTILEALHLPTDGLEGRSVYDVPDTEFRLRKYSAYLWESFTSEYLPPMTEYLVEGDAWEDESWHQGKDFVAPDAEPH